MLYALACVIAPVLEETMFRGALFHHLRRRWGWLISAGVVAIIFASIHVQGWTVAPTLATIALVLAAIRDGAARSSPRSLPTRATISSC